jgi:hypothetical protein
MLTDIFLGHALVGEYVFALLSAAAAWMIGRAVALNWQAITSLILYVLLLGVGSRFLHWALYQSWVKAEGAAKATAEPVSFGQTLTTLLSYYAVDTAVFMIVAILGYRFTRTVQMTTQYRWLYEKASPLSWRARS